jgi:hypothetical protein
MGGQIGRFSVLESAGKQWFSILAGKVNFSDFRHLKSYF